MTSPADETAAHLRAAWTLPCPYCHAPAMRACRTRAGSRLPALHAARLHAARLRAVPADEVERAPTEP